MSGSNQPPKKKDWVPGKPQIGVFLRTAQGSTLDCIQNVASDADQVLALALIQGGDRFPPALIASVKTAYDALCKPTAKKAG